MLIYTLRRILLAVPTLFGITLVTFVVINLAPGDPAQIGAQQVQDPRISARVYQQLREYYGLDKPVHVRYVQWLGRIVRLDFGNSMSTDSRPVLTKITERLWPTMSLALLTIAISLTLSIPIGVHAATRADGWFDTLSSTILYALYSVPSYVMAVPLILVIGVQWDLLPFQGMTSDNYAQLSPADKVADLVKHYTLISFCFSYGAWAYYSRFVRQNMMDVLRQDYIRTARAKGQSRFVIVWRHGFSNILIPMVTLLGMLLPEIIGGSVILEVMFNWPGIGRLFYDSILSRDYATVMALSTITAVLVLVGTLLADLGYAFVDPRITYD